MLKRLEIQSEYTIFKVGERVFQIGNINNISYDFLNNIVSLLDRGLKFIPCLNSNSLDIFKSLLFDFENNLSDLNKKLFFISKLNPIEEDEEINNLTDEFFSSFLKLTKKRVNLNNIPLTSQIIDFKFSFLRNLSNLKLDKENNISLSEKKTLFKFIKKNHLK